ncbi:DUF3299 domain-containing protein [Stutzerimonas balearica]|jgi:hypothetical protein|uniref:DUF3299 domain-containing protein n=1 Tax=Stutzerimonas balearica TaxID=74829 RepID=UPI000596C3FA|nr:DUF3299 domain-containing protein [Stutzerimonas balearica]KIL03349.1 lipoprotein [Stutzerimonas stutzeri]HAV87300.1 DUF3299 domain-containing protein [Pseudomonas sp.]MBD3737983.1 DUF3299 domain-containing protein [Stutzerimonas balearica]MBS4151935.1 DUF3299 domain-containing protein [Stutzerimonas balearica]WAN09626.1 DUF3299 domain-containing protein [Stutzerimonas balearica]
MRRFLACLLFCFASLTHAAPAELDWLELMPAEDRKALEEMPEIEHDSPENLGFSDAGGLKQGAGLPEVMYSARTVPALAGRAIRLGGYPVPLETDAAGRSTEFFLVPYPGACIHVPPPPPNQIVLVRLAKGIELGDIYAPLWVDGVLRIEPVNNALAEAAYAIDADAVVPVDEADLE